MKAKTLLKLSPEIYLLLATLYYWSLTSNLLNPFAIFSLVVLTLQILFKNYITGILISSALILINLFLILALLSELSEFSEPNENYYKLLIVAFLFIGFNLLAGSFMFWKYLKTNIK